MLHSFLMTSWSFMTIIIMHIQGELSVSIQLTGHADWWESFCLAYKIRNCSMWEWCFTPLTLGEKYIFNDVIFFPEIFLYICHYGILLLWYVWYVWRRISYYSVHIKILTIRLTIMSKLFQEVIIYYVVHQY